MHARDDEVVPLGPVHVDDDRVEAQPSPDGLDDLVEQAVGVALHPHQPDHVEQRLDAGRGGEVGRSRRDDAAAGRAAGAGVLEHRPRGGDDTAVKLRSGVLLELCDRGLARDRVVIGAVARHRVERVADRDDPRSERDRLAGEAVGIPGAVDALVRRADERGDAREHGCRVQDRLADGRVPADHLPLRRVQRARLVQDRPRDDDLADVVEVGGQADVVDLVLLDAELLGDRLRQLAHPVTVRAQLGRMLVEHRQEQVAGLALRRHAVVVLLGVHALIDDPKRGRGVAGLARQEDEPARRPDLVVLLGERRERLADRLLELGGGSVHDAGRTRRRPSR